MCNRCCDVAPQTFEAARQLLREFHILCERKRADGNKYHNDGPVQPLNDIKEELQRLVEDYTKHIYFGNSKIKSFVVEALSFVNIDLTGENQNTGS